LVVELKRELPEALRPRRIEIGAPKAAQVVQQQVEKTAA
jgi:hypothetical protein